jgi:general secretion pathway protein K
LKGLRDWLSGRILPQASASLGCSCERDYCERMQRQKGFILVAVIWLAGMVAAMAAGFAIKVRIETLSAANLSANTQAELIADGMARLTAWRLATGTYAVTQKGSLRGETWTCSWKPGVTVEVRVQDQAGLADLNTMPPEFFVEFFKKLGATQAQAENWSKALADFRDADDLGQDGAPEPRLYPDRDFGPKNASFQAIEELDQLPDMVDRIYRDALGFVTVYAGQPGIDPTTASPAMRKLFGQAESGDFNGLLVNYQGAPQGRAFGIDVRVTMDKSQVMARYRRKTVAVVLQQPEQPYVLLEWQRGGAWPVVPTPPAAQPCFN